MPWDPDHVFYVWFDALLNYYTALGFARDGEDLTDTFWPATFHVIGKDILKFHAVYLAGDAARRRHAGCPQHVFIHGYLLMKDASGAEHKMSKSLGNVLDPFEVMDTFGTDALRYYCFREVSLRPGRRRLDDHVRRALRDRARQRVRQPREPHAVDDRPLPRRRRARGRRRPGARAPTSTACARRSASCSTSAEITQALERIWQRVRRLNRYVEERAPWQLAKDEAKAGELDQTLRSLAEGLRVVTVLLCAVHPRDGGEAAGRARRAGRARSTTPRFGAEPGGARVEKLAAALPQAAEP